MKRRRSYRKTKRSKRYTRRRKQRGSGSNAIRAQTFHGAGPILESCGSGKCSTTGSTVVTYRGKDPVDSVPTFVSANEADKMYENDQY
jgi:hypothetical protein